MPQYLITARFVSEDDKLPKELVAALVTDLEGAGIGEILYDVELVETRSVSAYGVD